MSMPFTTQGSIVVFNPTGAEGLVAVYCIAVTPEAATEIADAMNVKFAEKLINAEF